MEYVGLLVTAQDSGVPEECTCSYQLVRFEWFRALGVRIAAENE